MNTRELIVKYLMEKQDGKCGGCGKDFGKIRIALQFANDPKYGGEKELWNVILMHGHCTTTGPMYRRIATVRELDKQGKSRKEIAEILDITLGTVYRYLTGKYLRDYVVKREAIPLDRLGVKPKKEVLRFEGFTFPDNNLPDGSNEPDQVSVIQDDIPPEVKREEE